MKFKTKLNLALAIVVIMLVSDVFRTAWTALTATVLSGGAAVSAMIGVLFSLAMTGFLFHVVNGSKKRLRAANAI